MSEQEYTLDAWKTKGSELFGENIFEWKFKCPVCGNIQTPEDFRSFENSGATPESALTECIGRYLPNKQKAFGPGKKMKGPCDYAAYGLFQLGPTFVDGKSIFAFAIEEQSK